MKKVEIFTDGACSGNPGPGGYGAILRYNGHEKEISGGEKRNHKQQNGTTCSYWITKVTKRTLWGYAYSDSQYVCNAFNLGWIKKWHANNWMRNKKEAVKNPDLWKELYALCEKHKVTYNWVKGHAGHPENERCDTLAVNFYQQYL